LQPKRVSADLPEVKNYNRRKNMNVYFGENLRRLRMERGMTQEGLGDHLGISFQSVSKWERGETLPDIEMLSCIAAFFDVTTDSLIGMERHLREKEVNQAIGRYSDLWSKGDYCGAFDVMKSAVTRFPGEYALWVRYLNVMCWIGRSDADKATKFKPEADAVYSRIADYCTEDNVRIWAKTIMCRYYRFLCDRNLGVTEEKVYEMLSGLPLMQNCRDYLGVTLLSGVAKSEQRKKTVAELGYLLSAVATGYDKPGELECAIATLEALFPEGDFGKATVNVALLYANLCRAYKTMGRREEASVAYEKALGIASAFDGVCELEHSSPLVRELSVSKNSVPMAQAGSLVNRVKTCAEK